MAHAPSNSISDEAVAGALKSYGLEATIDQIGQIQAYISLLLVWNQKVNLTAIQDPREILFRHFCESMFLKTILPLDRGRLADVGSGGGFPGLPLKIIAPGLEVVLIESNTKKATFLAEVVRDLELTGVRVVVRRYEDLGEEIAPLDFVCSRALGEFESFLRWAGAPSTAAKSVALWIGAGEIESVSKHVDWQWREPIPIPHSLRRFLLIGTRKAPE